MPGILPMKVITVGANAQTRIAQACDRCRSKKIRCDGIRPCCSQCANVGFECKTSDKLSRRAFPRGYTESLEEKVRCLESEVRELKDLLDEKDEKIDILSRIHSQSSQPLQLSSPRRPSTVSMGSTAQHFTCAEKDDVFKVQQSPYLLHVEGSDSYFVGTSSSHTFIDAFKQKVQEGGRSTDDIDTQSLLSNRAQGTHETQVVLPSIVAFKAPPRLVSDQLVNIFFQEWAPMFPVLHRPTFLNLYERFVCNGDLVSDSAELAQVNLVFAIAAVSSGSRVTADLNDFDNRWKTALDAILTENSMTTLQILILAQICCAQQGDFARLLIYKGLSTSLSARLGLHQSQKRFALGTLTCETRKKVFWSLYTVDCFTAVTFGLPKHIRDEDIQCEYPVDADDEYLTEQGFQPTPPGESTKLSSALALFRAARILSRVLESVFPAKASYELSLKKLSDLQSDLDAWLSTLAPHLRLEFSQDKPSTGTTDNRSPLLSLTYHYIGALIHRPAICASIDNEPSFSMIRHANSCKHIVQIMQLLEERGLCFAFCCRKDELLVVVGFGFLFQSLSLDPSSKMSKDNQKMIQRISRLLASDDAPCAQEFARVTNRFLSQTSSSPSSRSPFKATSSNLSQQTSDPSILINPLPILPSSTQQQLKAIASRFPASNNRKLDASGEGEQRPVILPTINLQPQSHTSIAKSRSFPDTQTDSTYPANSRSDSLQSSFPLGSQALSISPRDPSTKRSRVRTQLSSHTRTLNLDYLSFGPDTDGNSTAMRELKPVKLEPQPTDWERLLGNLDNGETNIYDACYGGQPVEALLSQSTPVVTDAPRVLTAIESTSWQPSADTWGASCQPDANNAVGNFFPNMNTGSDSMLSFSSGDDISANRSSSEGLDWIRSPTGDRTLALHSLDMTVSQEPEECSGSGSWDPVLVL